MALYHLSVKQIKCSAGQSAVAAAAYRAGENLHSDYYGEDSDYTKKKGVITADILLPPHAPPEYKDRETLWNAVEKVEEHPKRSLKTPTKPSFQMMYSSVFRKSDSSVTAKLNLAEAVCFRLCCSAQTAEKSCTTVRPTITNRRVHSLIVPFTGSIRTSALHTTFGSPFWSVWS